MLFTLKLFIESGEYARHVKRMNHQYDTRRRLLIAELQQRFREEIDIEDVSAGLHFLAHFHTGKGYQEIEESALRLKLEIYSMRRFMLEKSVNYENRISLILGFANLREENVAGAVDRLYDVFH